MQSTTGRTASLRRRLLSSLLALAMLVSVAFCVPGVNLVTEVKAAITATSVTLSPVYFYVPECIYVGQGTSGTTWYLNGKQNASTSWASAKETVGKLYFNCADATSVSISVSGGTTSDLTTTGTNTINDTSFTISNIKNLSNGTVITYTATFVQKGVTKTVTAYTYVYVPYRVPTGVATETESNKHSGKKYDYMGIISCIWGAQRSDTKTNNGGADSACYAEGTTIHLGQKGLHTAGNTRPHNTDMLDTGTGTFGYHNNDNVNTAMSSPTCYYYVDNSRFTNMNAIPNFYWGCVSTDDQHTDYHEVKSWLADGHTSGQSEPASISNIMSNTRVETETIFRQEGAQTISYGIGTGVISAGGSHNYTAFTYGRSYCGGTVTHSWQHIHFQIKSTYKANLRTAVENAIKASNYKYGSTLNNAIKAAATVLGNPYVEYSSVTSAITTLNNAVNGISTPTYNQNLRHVALQPVNNGNISGNYRAYSVLGTDTQVSTAVGNKVVFSANSYTGYTAYGYKANQSDTVNASSGTTYANNLSGITAGTSATIANVTGANSYTMYYKANAYTVAYNGNGATGGSTASSSHTYGVAKNLTANGFTRAYTVTYNYNGNGQANSTATATYSFAGWNTNSGGTGTSYSNSQSVSNLSSANGATVTLYAKWNPASVTLPTPNARTGYKFGGWYSGSTKIGNAGASYTPTANITLTANWT
ncbi:MAG: InlB B-repeat-containing protein, partial [Clostridia bacterium]|nr:InlB B-repeat-containing protein [Clostridia bacterium]